MEHNDAYFLVSMMSMQFYIFGKIIIIILRCWLLQLAAIHITKLQHPSHKNKQQQHKERRHYKNHLRINFITICITVAIIALKEWAYMLEHTYVRGFAREEGSWTFITSLWPS